MARPKNADGQRTRQAILDAALDLFAEKGFFGTSLRDVATAVGVRESALYNYFPGKDALFDALLSAQQDSQGRAARAARRRSDRRRPGGAAAAGHRHAQQLRRTARTEAVPHPDVGRHPSRQERPAQPLRAPGPQPRAAARHPAPADPRRLAAPRRRPCCWRSRSSARWSRGGSCTPSTRICR